MGAGGVGADVGDNGAGVAPNFSWAKLFSVMMKCPDRLKLIVIAALMAFTLILNNSAKAQDSTRLERYGLVFGSCIAFSLLDYVGYNVIVTPNSRNATSILSLHIFDAAFGGAINYFLYKTCGLPSAISFDLIWWTWGLDLGFSGWGDAIDPASPWVNRTNSSLNTNSITWAGWTPIGLLRKQGTVIDKYALYAQAIVGFSVSMPIIW